MAKDFDFKRDVVDLSFVKPVLIDFWADWCGPCKMLGPVLDELYREDNGKWELVKIDTEEYQEIASYFKIQSIPHCKLIYEGKIADEFSGAQTKAVVRKFIDKNMALLLADDVEPTDEYFLEIMSNQKSIPDPKFMQELKNFVESSPDHQQALIALAKHEVFYEPEKALLRINMGEDKKELNELKEDFEVVKEFMATEFDLKSQNGVLLDQIKINLLAGETQLAIQQIIESVTKDINNMNGLARRLGIALFHIWGSQADITKENRKLFDMAIW
ncbi:MAG TPA: thioredoxin domain-containing protein [Saprospiraceae bacterium]|nr:thioredoxin domain-containing protein [Saprospiraceae bacterium]